MKLFLLVARCIVTPLWVVAFLALVGVTACLVWIERMEGRTEKR